jgi:hypothetical protein
VRQESCANAVAVNAVGDRLHQEAGDLPTVPGGQKLDVFPLRCLDPELIPMFTIVGSGQVSRPVELGRDRSSRSGDHWLAIGRARTGRNTHAMDDPGGDSWRSTPRAGSTAPIECTGKCGWAS